MRAYGLGSALIVLTLALFWRVSQKPTRINIPLAALAAVLSVQCLYQNAFFVFAAACGGIVVCLSERRWRDTLWFPSIGALAALSLVPYVRIILDAQQWYMLQKFGFDFPTGWENFSIAAGFEALGFSWIWVALCLAAIWTSLSVIAPHTQPTATAAHRNLIRFGTTALVMGIIGFVVFLKIASLEAGLWYFTPLMVFIVVCLDAVLPCAIAGQNRC